VPQNRQRPSSVRCHNEVERVRRRQSGQLVAPGERIEVLLKIRSELPLELTDKFFGMITDPVDKQYVQRPAEHPDLLMRCEYGPMR